MKKRPRRDFEMRIFEPEQTLVMSEILKSEKIRFSSSVGGNHRNKSFFLILFNRSTLLWHVLLRKVNRIR